MRPYGKFYTHYYTLQISYSSRIQYAGGGNVQSSSAILARLVGLRLELDATLSSSLRAALRRAALMFARFLRWYSLSRCFFCCAALVSCLAGGTTTVVSPGVGMRDSSPAVVVDSSPSPASSRAWGRGQHFCVQRLGHAGRVLGRCAVYGEPRRASKYRGMPVREKLQQGSLEPSKRPEIRAACE